MALYKSFVGSSGVVLRLFALLFELFDESAELAVRILH